MNTLPEAQIRLMLGIARRELAYQGRAVRLGDVEALCVEVLERREADTPFGTISAARIADVAPTVGTLRPITPVVTTPKPVPKVTP